MNGKVGRPQMRRCRTSSTRSTILSSEGEAEFRIHEATNEEAEEELNHLGISGDMEQGGDASWWSMETFLKSGCELLQMQWQQLMERQWKTDKMRMTTTTPVKAKKRNQQTRAQCLMRVGIQFPDPTWIELLQEPNPKKGSGLKN